MNPQVYKHVFKTCCWHLIYLPKSQSHKRSKSILQTPAGWWWIGTQPTERARRNSSDICPPSTAPRSWHQANWSTWESATGWWAQAPMYQIIILRCKFSKITQLFEIVPAVTSPTQLILFGGLPTNLANFPKGFLIQETPTANRRSPRWPRWTVAWDGWRVPAAAWGPRSPKGHDVGPDIQSPGVFWVQRNPVPKNKSNSKHDLSMYVDIWWYVDICCIIVLNVWFVLIHYPCSQQFI